MGKVMGLGLNTNDNGSYKDETLVGAGKKSASSGTCKQISYDSCIWKRCNEEILVDQKGYAIIRDVDGLLKKVLLSKWPRKEGEELGGISFQLINVLTMDPGDAEKDEEREHYTDI